MQRIQSLNRFQRIGVFVLIFGGGLLLLLGVSLVLFFQALNATPRSQATPVANGITAAEFVQLPDDDAYPASVATAPNGKIYTASYVTGALWVIDPTGTITEIPDSRKLLTAVAGLTVAPDNTLYIVVRKAPDLGAQGGAVMRLRPDGVIEPFATPTDGFVSPDDITLDSHGRVYVSDRGRSAVIRFDPDGKNSLVWWTSPAVPGAKLYAPTGLAYDAAHDAILVTDPEVNAIYRVPVSDPTQTETLYLHGSKPDAPGFDGITITTTGTIYVAALGLNQIVRLDSGTLTTIASGFRGGSDVDSFTLPNGTVKLYVSDWDQLGLLLSAYHPRLPFALDVLTIPPP